MSDEMLRRNFISRKCSKYYDQLEGDAKKRNVEKLDLIWLNFDDPYTLNYSKDLRLLPEIEYPDIYNYLISTPSPYTMDELKSYKSMEGYKYLLAGWVGDVSVCPVAADTDKAKVVVTAEVRHSQKVSEAPVKPWIVSEMVGTIVCAHCTCMAGWERPAFT